MNTSPAEGDRPRPGTPSRWPALGVSLHATQGIVVAYLFNFNKAYLHACGLGVARIGRIQTVALLPLVLKFLVGPLSDRSNLLGFGHRLPYIVLGLLTPSASLVFMAHLDPGRHPDGFAAAAALAVVGLAFYDTCCDGLIVEVTPRSDRTRVQGLLWCSRFVAATAFALGFGFGLDFKGGARHADDLLKAAAALTLFPCAIALVLRERPRPEGREPFDWSAVRVMARPWSLRLIAFGTSYGIAGMAVGSNLSPHYRSLGFGQGGDVGALGAARNLGRAAGAPALPLAAVRFGRRSVLVLGVLSLAIRVAAQVPVKGRVGAVAAGFALAAALGWDDALFAALAMEGSDPRLAASTFALFMAVTNLSVLEDALFSAGAAVTGSHTVPLLVAATVSLFALPHALKLARPANVWPYWRGESQSPYGRKGEPGLS